MNETKYLVTGGAGFIGSNFVRYLFRRHKNIRVCVLDKLGYSASLDSLKPFSGRNDFSFIKGDICDPAAVKKAMAGSDYVIKLRC